MPQKIDIDVTENAALATAEFAPTADQTQAILQGCLGQALNGPQGLSLDDKALLRTRIDAVKANLAKAVDMVSSKRSRLKQERQRLRDERDRIGDGNKDFADFYRLAARAVANCTEASRTAQYTKSGLDMVFSRQVEITYRLGLLSVLETRLSMQEEQLTSAVNGLDSMLVAIL